MEIIFGLIFTLIVILITASLVTFCVLVFDLGPKGWKEMSGVELFSGLVVLQLIIVGIAHFVS